MGIRANNFKAWRKLDQILDSRCHGNDEITLNFDVTLEEDQTLDSGFRRNDGAAQLLHARHTGYRFKPGTSFFDPASRNYELHSLDLKTNPWILTARDGGNARGLSGTILARFRGND